MDMVEKVAMAIANTPDEDMVDPKTPWNKCDNSMRQDYRSEAREAIRAMEPTEEMLKAGTVELSAFNDDYDTLKGGAEAIWNAMIAAALTPAKTVD